MSEQLDLATFTGPHPTNADFAQQLAVWGFTERRVDGVHRVLRARGGGSVRVLRSLMGRADADTVAKAARLCGVTVERFWLGPTNTAAASTETMPAARLRRRSAAGRDRVISMVLAAHAGADRPLGFEQVVQLCHGRITREQARTASATLCRDGQLDRIRSGVYQWSGGAREIAPSGRALRTAPPLTVLPVAPAALDAAAPAAAALFSRLFPEGVHMTAELLADLGRWSQLTEKLAAQADPGTDTAAARPRPTGRRD